MLKIFRNISTRFHKIHDDLISEERLVPEFQQNVPWLRPHYERYYFAANFLHPADTCLDIACGAGYGTDILSKKCTYATGVDRSRKAIEYASQKYPQVEYVCEDFFYNNLTADVVVSFETIEHIDANFESILFSLVARSRKKLIGSFPYMEKKGNKFHKKFFLTEKDIYFLKKIGNLEFFFQAKEPSYEIAQAMAEDERQNVVFVFSHNF